jgi:hypothetical protein
MADRQIDETGEEIDDDTPPAPPAPKKTQTQPGVIRPLRFAKQKPGAPQPSPAQGGEQIKMAIEGTPSASPLAFLDSPAPILGIAWKWVVVGGVILWLAFFRKRGDD